MNTKKKTTLSQIWAKMEAKHRKEASALLCAFLRKFQCSRALKLSFPSQAHNPLFYTPKNILSHTQEKEKQRPREIFTSLLWEGEYAEELREDSSVARTMYSIKWPNYIDNVFFNFFL